MNAEQARNKNGFTIIEVVLVLAIAALIFLMVFIALPALQRNQRDTQRKDDIGRTLTAINNYQSNNRGKLPHQATGGGATDAAKWVSFKQKYLQTEGDSFADPSGENEDSAANGGGYKVEEKTASDTEPDWDNDDDKGVIYFTTEASCGDDGAVSPGAGTRKVALRIALEGGGVYCQSN